jgi:hypothetical protein
VVLGLTEAPSKAGVEEGCCATLASVNAQRTALLIITRRIGAASFGAPIPAGSRASEFPPALFSPLRSNVAGPLYAAARLATEIRPIRAMLRDENESVAKGMSLRDIFCLHGTDKVEYAGLYEALFPMKARLTTLHFLEIGIGTAESMQGYAASHYRSGGSLRAWRAYFPNATILGIDLAPITIEGVETVVLDTTARASVQDWFSTYSRSNTRGLFDVIIDDGDHTQLGQLETLTNFWSLLSVNGLYVIEDALSSQVFQAGRLHALVAPSIPFTAVDGKCVVIAK